MYVFFPYLLIIHHKYRFSPCKINHIFLNNYVALFSCRGQSLVVCIWLCDANYVRLFTAWGQSPFVVTSGGQSLKLVFMRFR